MKRHEKDKEIIQKFEGNCDLYRVGGYSALTEKKYLRMNKKNLEKKDINKIQVKLPFSLIYFSLSERENSEEN